MQATKDAQQRDEEQAKVLSKRDEGEAEVHNAEHANKIVTAGNFDDFFRSANVSDTSAFFLNMWHPGSGLRMHKGTWRILGDKLARNGHTDKAVGSLNCAAFPRLCHSDERLALPRKVQWPQIMAFNKKNMQFGAEFPGELYTGNPKDQNRLVTWLLDKQFSEEMAKEVADAAKERKAQKKKKDEL